MKEQAQIVHGFQILNDLISCWSFHQHHQSEWKENCQNLQWKHHSKYITGRKRLTDNTMPIQNAMIVNTMPVYPSSAWTAEDEFSPVPTNW
jgi:hypothetical protein